MRLQIASSFEGLDFEIKSISASVFSISLDKKNIIASITIPHGIHIVVAMANPFVLLPAATISFETKKGPMPRPISSTNDLIANAEPRVSGIVV
mmetsp:Transcript_4425/g.5139  ORF Transcript_4425/g.5139 Transcript_4425/m.5139 type:complete len:94 (-) Transcript_4425:1364-1645(-)